MRRVFVRSIGVCLLLACLFCGTACRMMRDDIEVVHADGTLDRDLAVRLNRKGSRAFELGHLDKAETLLQEAVLADASYGVAHNNLGLVYFERGDLYSAAWSFQRAAEAMPERPEPLNNLGMVYEAAGRHDAAIEQYRLAHELQPENPEYLGNLLRARRNRGDLDISVEEQLRELLFVETRPEWREWAEDQLVLFLPKEIARLSGDEETPQLEAVPTPEPNEGERSSSAEASPPASLPIPRKQPALELAPPAVSPPEPSSRLRRHVEDD